MATSSPARIAASCANSTRSSGPKTAAGKARSCRNATRHGLAGAGVAPLAEDRELLDRKIAAWVEELGAVGDLEVSLVVEAAAASVRLRRADLTEAARAEARAAEVRSRRLAKVRAQLADAAAKLRGWAAAADHLAAEGAPIPSHHQAFADLLGVPALAPGGAIDRRLRALKDPADRLTYRRPTDAVRDEARAALADLLEAHRAEAATRVDACRAAVAAAEADPLADAWFDPSPKGELLRRYRNAAERAMQRALARLERLRRLPDSPIVVEDDDSPRNESRTLDAATVCDPPAGIPSSNEGPAGPPAPAPSEPLEATLPAAGDASRNEARSGDLTTTCGSRPAPAWGQPRYDDGPLAPAVAFVPVTAAVPRR